VPPFTAGGGGGGDVLSDGPWANAKGVTNVADAKAKTEIRLRLFTESSSRNDPEKM